MELSPKVKSQDKQLSKVFLIVVELKVKTGDGKKEKKLNKYWEEM